MVEILAEHRAGREGQCGTIQEDRFQELVSVVMPENLYSGNLRGGSAQGVSGNSSGGLAVTGESSSGGRSLPVNVLGNGSGGASTSGQASAFMSSAQAGLFRWVDCDTCLFTL